MQYDFDAPCRSAAPRRAAYRAAAFPRCPASAAAAAPDVARALRQAIRCRRFAFFHAVDVTRRLQRLPPPRRATASD